MNSAPLLAVNNLSIEFDSNGRAPVRAVRKAQFNLARGQVTALCGPSGAGKSALAHCLLGLLPAGTRVGGHACLDGLDLCGLSEKAWRDIRGSKIAGIFQEPHAALNPVVRIGAQLNLICRRHRTSLGSEELLSLVGLPDDQDWASRYPHQLSGGQAQRVLIAMALACNPCLLIADEPTAALDRISGADIMRLLLHLASSRGLAVLLVSHDRELVDGLVAQQIWMENGKTDAKPAPMERFEPDVPRRPGTGSPVLRVTNLSVDYGRGRSRVKGLEAVNLQLAPAEILALSGASGSGKTTVARALVGLLPQATGELQLAGETVAWGHRQPGQRRFLQMLFQDPYTSLNPRRRVLAVLSEALQQAGRPISEAAQCLAELGLDESYLSRYPHQLSGGQRQRVALARALAVSPQVLILDEAFSALDVPVRDQLTQLILNLSRSRRLACLWITHDLARLPGVADRVAVMHHGNIVEQGPTRQILERPDHPETCRMLAALI